MGENNTEIKEIKYLTKEKKDKSKKHTQQPTETSNVTNHQVNSYQNHFMINFTTLQMTAIKIKTDDKFC